MIELLYSDHDSGTSKKPQSVKQIPPSALNIKAVGAAYSYR